MKATPCFGATKLQVLCRKEQGDTKKKCRFHINTQKAEQTFNILIKRSAPISENSADYW